MACFLNTSISVSGRQEEASVALIPEGRCSKAFCSSDFSFSVTGEEVGLEGERFDPERLIGDPSTGV
jgi:hypothetical protein